MSGGDSSFMKEHEAVSSVVGTVLILVITVASVGVVGFGVYKAIGDPSGAPAVDLAAIRDGDAYIVPHKGGDALASRDLEVMIYTANGDAYLFCYAFLAGDSEWKIGESLRLHHESINPQLSSEVVGVQIHHFREGSRTLVEDWSGTGAPFTITGTLHDNRPLVGGVKTCGGTGGGGGGTIPPTTPPSGLPCFDRPPADGVCTSSDDFLDLDKVRTGQVTSPEPGLGLIIPAAVGPIGFNTNANQICFVADGDITIDVNLLPSGKEIVIWSKQGSITAKSIAIAQDKGASDGTMLRAAKNIDIERSLIRGNGIEVIAGLNVMADRASIIDDPQGGSGGKAGTWDPADPCASATNKGQTLVQAGGFLDAPTSTISSGKQVHVRSTGVASVERSGEVNLHQAELVGSSKVVKWTETNDTGVDPNENAATQNTNFNVKVEGTKIIATSSKIQASSSIQFQGSGTGWIFVQGALFCTDQGKGAATNAFIEPDYKAPDYVGTHWWRTCDHVTSGTGPNK